MLKIPFSKALVSAAVLGLAILPLAASAGEVGDRLGSEQARIHQAFATGRISYGEFRSLEGEAQGINAQRERDLRVNGGFLTRGEDFRLNREEDRLSARIAFESHEGRR